MKETRIIHETGATITVSPPALELEERDLATDEAEEAREAKEVRQVPEHARARLDGGTVDGVTYSPWPDTDALVQARDRAVELWGTTDPQPLKDALANAQSGWQPATDGERITLLMDVVRPMAAMVITLEQRTRGIRQVLVATADLTRDLASRTRFTLRTVRNVARLLDRMHER